MSFKQGFAFPNAIVPTKFYEHSSLDENSLYSKVYFESDCAKILSPLLITGKNRGYLTGVDYAFSIIWADSERSYIDFFGFIVFYHF